MDADARRAALVEEARSWIGTPWVHAHDLKGVGVDCAMLLLRVYVDTGVVEPFDPRPYPDQWHLHHDASRFLDIVRRLGGRSVDEALPGDIAMYNFGRHPAHGAIVVDEHYMIHAFKPRERVILDTRLALRDNFAGYWSLF